MKLWRGGVPNDCLLAGRASIRVLGGLKEIKKESKNVAYRICSCYHNCMPATQSKEEDR
jgi:hypothetical protein